MKTIWAGTRGEEALPEVAQVVADALAGAKPFALWLKGPLGAGKTTLTGYILRTLGLPAGVRVTSPTYTYMNDYKIKGEWFAHLDLYRSRGAFSPEEVGLADARQFSGIFVEWPEKSPPDDPYLKPTHILEIGMADGGQQRTYLLQESVLDHQR